MHPSHNILYLYESAVGLGHQRRASGVVNGLVESGFNVSVASGSFVSPHEYFHPQASIIRLPANRRDIDGKFFYYDETNTLVHDPDHNHDEWKTRRADALLTLANDNRIDALVAEWWPFDRRRHFSNIIDAMMEAQEQTFGRKPLLISSVRDVPKSGNKKNREEARSTEELVVDIINKSVDAVLVHGDPALVALEEGFSLHAQIEKPIFYTGYVVNDHARESASDRNKIVMVSCGSGDDGHHLLKSAFRALTHSQHLKDHEWHFVMGPRMEVHHRHEFFETIQSVMQETPGVRAPVVHEHMSELPQELVKSAFSISLAGYNTTLEVLASRVPAILVPKFVEHEGEIVRMDAEQWDRLERLQARDMASIAHPHDTIKPETFSAIIDNAFRKGTTFAPLDMDGINKTAQIMHHLLSKHRSHGHEMFLSGATLGQIESSQIQITPPEIPLFPTIDLPERRTVLFAQPSALRGTDVA